MKPMDTLFLHELIARLKSNTSKTFYGSHLCLLDIEVIEDYIKKGYSIKDIQAGVSQYFKTIGTERYKTIKKFIEDFEDKNTK